MDAFGDSIMIGDICTNCDFVGNSTAELKAANPARYVTAINYAVAGEAHAVSFSKAQTHIPLDTSQFAYWFVWSPNDGYAAANVQASYDNYLNQFITLAHASGVIPVLFTSLPNVNLALAADNVRKSINASTLAKAANDVLTIDMDALITDGGSPARMQSQYDLDGIHPNAAGAAVMESAVKTTIQNYWNTH